MDKCVAQENIQHFHDRLETESEGATRGLFHAHLVQEEDRLGYNSEALHVIERHIARAKDHANRQQTLIASAERDGRDATQALAFLDAYSKTLLVYENQHQKLLTRITQSGL